MSKVIKLHPEEKYYARCPECGSFGWNIRIDGVGDQWENITGTECSNPDCDFFCDWVLVQLEEIKDEEKI